MQLPLDSLSLVCSILLLLAERILCKGEVEQVDTCECNDDLFPTQVANNSRYFCGEDLNRMTSGQSCTPDKLYMCSRHNRTAVAIGRCPRTKRSGCNHSFQSRNNCLRSMKCTCRGVKPSASQVACGDQLQGSDCIPNVLYQCRLIGSPVPLQSCPSSCSNGKCVPRIIEVSLQEVDKPPTTPNSRRRTPRPRNLNRTQTNSSEHEEEFVTFAPLIHPLFNP